MKRVYELFLFTAVIVCCALFVIACEGPGGNGTGVLPDNVYIVRATAPDGGDGRSWDTAFNHPGDALDAATAGDQIWVAEGTYTRKEDTDTVLLTLKSGVAVYGGFDGTEFSLAERSWHDNETVLDGEDAVYHVVVGAEDALLDGFTVTGGNANGDGHDGNGGGIWTQTSAGSPIVAHCIITQNSARTGGGMYIGNCSPLVMDCVLSDNSAAKSPEGAGTGNGGGVYSQNNTANDLNRSSFLNCLFVNNSAEVNGGAVYIHMFCWSMNICLRNCTVTANSAGGDGDDGDGIYILEGSANITYPICQLSDCILWGNDSNDVYLNNSTTMVMTSIHFCLVGTGVRADGDPLNQPTYNLYSIYDTNPDFIPGPRGPYYLAHLATGQADDSPCIDAGSVYADYCSIPGLSCKTTRIDGIEDTTRVDMGYHYDP